ncbi:MAG: GTP-binding protein [Peptoniphilus sp.]|nr:GTP-binding protein [Peptoniphilus sp.]
MKVLIISGFLGSGKTTFIQNFSKRVDDIAILENDYAKANIDRDLLKSDNNVISLEEGCICCSKKSDFATTVLTISNTVNPQYLVIEPTGVGYLSKVIDNIRSVQYEQIEMLSPITIVDYYTIDETLKEYGELFIDQVKNAGHILLSKTENVSEESIRAAVKKLEKFTEGKVYTDHYSTFSTEQWEDLLKGYDYSNLSLNTSSEVSMQSYSYKEVFFNSFQDVGTVFNAVCSGRFGKLVRAKGFIEVGDKIVKVDVVQGKFTIERYDGERPEMNIVFLGSDLDKHAFDVLFK